MFQVHNLLNATLLLSRKKERKKERERERERGLYLQSKSTLLFTKKRCKNKKFKKRVFIKKIKKT